MCVPNTQQRMLDLCQMQPAADTLGSWISCLVKALAPWAPTVIAPMQRAAQSC